MRVFWWVGSMDAQTVVQLVLLMVVRSVPWSVVLWVLMMVEWWALRWAVWMVQLTVAAMDTTEAALLVV